MRKSFYAVSRPKLLMVFGILSVFAAPSAASAQERAITGAAIGAGAGALVLGPIGAVAGGAVGAIVGGPKVSRARHHRHCWRDRRGRRHCRWD